LRSTAFPALPAARACRQQLPPPARSDNRYRENTETDAERLRLLIGLRQLDIPLEQAAELASMCAGGRCDEVSDELRALLVAKRAELARRVDETRFLDRRMAHLAGQLEAGGAPGSIRSPSRYKRPAQVRPLSVRDDDDAPRSVAFESFLWSLSDREGGRSRRLVVRNLGSVRRPGLLVEILVGLFDTERQRRLGGSWRQRSINVPQRS
jgi:DNA-binding transcriptional MerR regulator